MIPKRAVELLAAGVSQAEVARQLGVNKSTVYRWVRAQREQGAAEASLNPSDTPALNLQSEAASGLADLVPRALQLLEAALDGQIPASKARVALDIVKAAASVTGEKSGGELARRIAVAEGLPSD